MRSDSRRAASTLLCSMCLILAGGCVASERPQRYQISHQFNADDPRFARAVGSIFGPSLVDGNSATVLLNGHEIFPAMLEAIHSAKRTITFETYIYWSGTIGNEFADAFSERARAGVKVKIMLDWIGSGRLDGASIKEMRDAGVHLVRYHPFHLLDPTTYALLDHRTHRKILVIDGTVGFTGGVGIADMWRGNADASDHWRDDQFRVTGPVVAQLQAAFMDNWMQTTGQVLQGDAWFPRLDPTGPEVAQVCKSSWTGGAENMQLLVLMGVSAASKSIRIESAYFVPDGLTSRALIAARKRGVSVQIIVPGRHVDTPIVRSASRARWGDLLNTGVEIYEYSHTMFHCKQMIVDDLWVSIGSANMDNRSFRINDEANLNVLDASFASLLSRIFDQDRERARRITYEQWRDRPLLEKLTDDFASILGGEF